MIPPMALLASGDYANPSHWQFFLFSLPGAPQLSQSPEKTLATTRKLVGTRSRLKTKQSEDAFILQRVPTLKKKKIWKRGLTLFWSPETSLWVPPLNDGTYQRRGLPNVTQLGRGSRLDSSVSSSGLSSLHDMSLQNGGWQRTVLISSKVMERKPIPHPA